MRHRLRVWWACLVALAAVLLPVGAALAAPAAPASLVGFLPMDDDAVGYAVSYAVQRDGSMDVTQRIRWDFPDGEERHGIFRTIQVRAGYQDSTTQYRHYELSDVEVSSPTGAPTDVDLSDFGAYEQVRIGNADEWADQEAVDRLGVDNGTIQVMMIETNTRYLIDSATIRMRGGLLSIHNQKPEDLLEPPLEDYARILLGMSRP